MAFGVGRVGHGTSTCKTPRESGYGHWRWQRISAVITLILMVYFTYLVASLGPLNYPEAHSFVATPHRGIALGLLVIVVCFTRRSACR